MKEQAKEKFLIAASHPDSLINFRGPLLIELKKKNLEVHVATPNLKENHLVKKTLNDMDIFVHEIHLDRTGMNPLLDIKTIYQFWNLMRHIKPDYFLGYTHKPVIYGNLAAWFCGVPKRYALITGLGYTFQSNILWLNYILKKLYKITLRHAAKVIFQNPDDEKYFYKY